MKTRLIAMMMGILTIAGCKKDETGNGVADSTLVVNGVEISLPLITCSQFSSSYNLKFTATDIAQTQLLELYFDDYPTTTKTFAVSSGGSGAEAWGDYTVNGNVDYVTQSGTITVTPRGNDSFTVTFKDVVTESNNSVQAILSFNGTCN
jgi:hypothetical protein